MMITSFMNIRERFDCWREKSRQQRELREYVVAIGKDIGVSRATLDLEANRCFLKEVSETPDSSHRNRKPLAV